MPNLYLLKIEKVDYLGKHSLEIFFSDGAIQQINFAPFLEKSMHPEIRKFLNIRKFKKYNFKNGALIWGDYDLVFPIIDLYENQIERGGV